MTKYCITDNSTILVHCIMGVDIVLGIAFIINPTRSYVRIATFCLLDMNLFFICLLSFYYFTGIEPTFTVQSIGVVVGLLIGLFHSYAVFKSVSSLVLDLLLTSLLLISAQLTNTYIPKLLNARFGISVTTASAVLLLLPVILFYVIRVVASSKPFAVAMNCLAVAFLVTLSYSVLKDSPWPRNDVCCDIDEECPLHFSLSDFVICTLLFITFMSVYFSEWLHHRYMKDEKWSPWWCCKLCYKKRFPCCCCRDADRIADTEEDESTTEQCESTRVLMENGRPGEQTTTTTTEVKGSLLMIKNGTFQPQTKVDRFRLFPKSAKTKTKQKNNKRQTSIQYTDM